MVGGKVSWRVDEGGGKDSNEDVKTEKGRKSIHAQERS